MRSSAIRRRARTAIRFRARSTGRPRATTSLAKSEPGNVAVARISEKLELSDDGLQLIATARLVPGQHATIVGRINDGVRVKTDSGEHVVPDAVAEQLYVVRT